MLKKFMESHERRKADRKIHEAMLRQAEWFNSQGGLRCYLDAYLRHMDDDRVLRWRGGLTKEQAPYQVLVVRMAALGIQAILAGDEHSLDEEQKTIWLDRARRAWILAAGYIDDEGCKRMAEIFRGDDSIPPDKIAVLAFTERVELAKARWDGLSSSGGNPFGFNL